jgi:hypothetical protein
LNDDEFSGVDDLLRRSNGLLTQTGHLDPSEKQEVIDAQGVLVIDEVDSIENGFVEYLSCQRTY